MHKRLFKRASVCTLALSLAVLTNFATQAQDIGLPPANYNQVGQYPAGTVKNYYYYSNVTNSQRKLVVYTPPGYTAGKKYPVVYSIHGIDNIPESIFADWCVDADLVADNLIGSGQIEPCIIVAWDNNNIDTRKELLENIIPYVERTFPVIKDADHRALYGYSMGGGFTFQVGMSNLDVFHHLSPSSAVPFHPSDEDMFKKGSPEITSRLKTLVLSCGTNDWCGFYPPNLASHNYCVQYNIPHYWMSVQGGNHDGKVWSPAMYYLLKYAFPKNGTPTPSTPEPAGVPGETANIPDGTYYIKNINADKYLTVTDNSAKSGANVELRTKANLEGQKWTIKNLSDGYITLTSELGEFMLDVTGDKNEDGTNISIYNSHSGTAQQYVVKTTSTDGVYTIATKSSGLTKVLDDSDRNTNDGANVCQWSYNGNTNQQWAFEKVEPVAPGEIANIADGTYFIKNVNADKYLTVADNSAKAGSNVELRTKANLEGQKWTVKNLGNGYITLTSALGNFMLDVAYGKDENGANIGIYNDYAGTAQQYVVKNTSKADTYIIATKASGLTKVLDDYEHDKKDGANVCQWQYYGNPNQQWLFEKADTNTVSTSQLSALTTPEVAKPEITKPETSETPVVQEELALSYNITSWGTGSNISFKLTNNSASEVKDWCLKINKNDVKITSSWNMTVEETEDAYLITPLSWNATIAAGGAIEFGVITEGNVNETIHYSFS